MYRHLSILCAALDGYSGGYDVESRYEPRYGDRANANVRKFYVQKPPRLGSFLDRLEYGETP